MQRISWSIKRRGGPVLPISKLGGRATLNRQALSILHDKGYVDVKALKALIAEVRKKHPEEKRPNQVAYLAEILGLTSHLQDAAISRNERLRKTRKGITTA